ncbi:MAG: filamentous hemagglutinin N-terminal domain-containing protein [Tolypothrix brevis GSE-NOS-MK-07-07A]|jgi:filamentous hemagglutinin family protein|nr:filamentous hemagglutinin N-terminal domain-containing protein [Tolypothrix brevis GSE-NOS-MK-07-07A]
MSNRWGWLIAIALGSSIFWGNNASAQITPDGTLPNNSIVTPGGNILNITGGSQIGNNLFHSFQEFSVPTGGTAFFNNGLDIGNIISRVTGNSISNIDGLIRANGTANVFLLNPNGIIFGNNASLNVGGSFVGSTANAIQFGTAGIFSATTPNAPTPLLTINPSALLFLQPSPAAITSRSIAPAGVDLTGVEVTGLRVPDGRSLLLVGGDVNVDGGSLRAYNGRIELAGLAAPGNVGLNFTGNILSLGVPNVPKGNVSLTNAAELNVRGSDGGSVAINAQNLSLAGASKVRAGIDTGLGTLQSVAGDIDINATGSTILTDDSFIANVLQPSSVGKGGNVNITTSSLALINGISLNTNNFGQGDGGNINLNVRDALTLSGVGEVGSSAILSSLQAQAVGKGGSINITAGSVSLADGAFLISSTFGQGDAGNVSIQARDFVSLVSSSNIFSNVEAGGVGNGGNINIKSGSFSLADGAFLSSSTFGQGNAGNVSIQARDFVSLAGSSTAIFSTVEAGGIGNGGNINITASSLSLTDGSQLQTILRRSDTQNNLLGGRGNAGNVNIDVNGAVIIAGQRNGLTSGIRSSVGTGATGNAGNINIKSGSFSLTDDAELSSGTFGQGNAGSVFIQASDAVSFINGDIFSTVQPGSVGNGGNIDIKAASLTLTDGAQLITNVEAANDTLPGGRGNAGNVNIDVSGKVTISGVKDEFGSAILSRLRRDAIGNGGDINIKSGSFELSNGALLSASTFGEGNAGSVFIQASDAVSLADADIFSNVQPGAVGNSGNINVKARTLSLTDNSSLFATTSGQGNAGNISVQVTDSVSLANSIIFSNVADGAVGNSGNINVQARTLSLTDNSSLVATTFGQGNGGNISIQATDSVFLAGQLNGITTNVSDGAVGNAGDINIQTGLFTLTDESQVGATNLGGKGLAGNIFINTANDFSITRGAFVSAASSGEGNAGKITIRSGGAVLISGRGDRTSSAVTSGILDSGVGNGGDIEIQARSFSLSDGADLFTFTVGKGNAGNISINTIDDFTVKNASVATFTSGQGNAGKIAIRAGGNVSISDRANFLSSVAPEGIGSGGDIEIQGRSFSLSDNAQLFTATFGKGDAGNFQINTSGDIIIKSGGQIRADTFGQGNAGNVSVNAGGTVSLDGVGFDGSRSGISTQVTAEEGFVGRGEGGNINITARNLSITNRAALTSSSSGQGNAGDININTRSVRLDNQGMIAASTNSGNGGNINLTAADFLLLRRNSSISTTAGLTQSGGDGGNITINTPFIVAVPNENSDITANAFTGRGGNVNIRSQGIFGIEARLQPTPQSDITASSQFGLSGDVIIKTPDIDPTQGLVELPTGLTDVSRLVDTSCAAIAGKNGSEFIVTGRGGLPPSPDDFLSSDVVWSDNRMNATITQQPAKSALAQLNVRGASPTGEVIASPPSKTKAIEIIPATGWIFNHQTGEVTLISSAPNASNSGFTPPNCSK